MEAGTRIDKAAQSDQVVRSSPLNPDTLTCVTLLL